LHYCIETQQAITKITRSPDFELMVKSVFSGDRRGKKAIGNLVKGCENIEAQHLFPLVADQHLCAARLHGKTLSVI